MAYDLDYPDPIAGTVTSHTWPQAQSPNDDYENWVSWRCPKCGNWVSDFGPCPA